ncbi:MAG: NrfD/PsrC family molybdoenzyme membrane anchor subunit, partial [Chloroflexota bacterium]
MAWGFFIAAYLFAAGMGAGAFLAALTAELYSRQGFRPLIRSGTVISGPLVLAGMPFLLLDLGIGLREPWRLIYLFFGNGGSIMTWGAWIITMFSGVALLCAVADLDLPLGPYQRLHRLLAPHRRPLMMLGGLLAFCTAIYTGLLLGVVNGVPLWNTAVLPALFFVSALSTGLAAAVVFAVLFPIEERKLLSEHFFYLNQIHALMIFVELIFIFCWLFISAGASSTAAKSVALLMSGPQAWLFWLGVVFFG